MGLAENAAARAISSDAFGAGTPELTPSVESYAPLLDLNIPDPDPNGYADMPVHLAWLKVRADIKSIAKDDYNQNQKYNFRGIDAALNAFGPVTLRHGVNILPYRVEASYRDTHTSQNKPTRECTVNVTWRIYGPKGDFFEAQTAGESLDSADKGSSKAQSVALRTLLLNGGIVPTGDPEPDASSVERGEAPVRDADSYMAEAFNPATTISRLQQIYRELVSARMRDVRVRNEIGESESIGELVVRIGKERKASGGHVRHEPGGWSEVCPACALQSAADRELAGSAA
jgi:hypothetical protein